MVSAPTRQGSTPPQQFPDDLSANPWINIYAAWQKREHLTPEQVKFLADRGCSPTPWNEEPFTAVRQLVGAGFDMYQTINLMDLPTEETVALFEAIPPELPMIYGLHAQGKTPVEIADHSDLPRSTVYYHLDRAGLTPNRANAPELTVTKQAKIVSLYNKGVSQAEIARKLGVTYHQVRAAIRRAT